MTDDEKSDPLDILPPVINDLPPEGALRAAKTAKYRKYRPKGGRPSFVEVEQISKERFLAVCQALGSIRAVAEHYGTTKKTIHATLKRFGIESLKEMPALPHRSPLTGYLRANPGSAIDALNIPEVSEAVGMTQRSIRNWLQARRASTLQFVKAAGDLRFTEGTIIDLRGRHIPFTAVREYALHLDLYEGELTIKGQLIAGGPFTAHVNVFDYLRALGAIYAGSGQRGPLVMWTYPRWSEQGVSRRLASKRSEEEREEQ